MTAFIDTWQSAARTTVGLFWMAFWAFGLGYLISSMIQVFVSRERMHRSMGEAGPRSVALGTFFGFISSSCSFAALSTTRSLFTKGAGLIPSLAFLLASTNLVIELGIVIAVFLSWQFVVGEYIGGIILILLTWILVRIFRPGKLEETAREHAREQEGGSDDDGEIPDAFQLMQSREGWLKVARQYTMEWGMVWKDVTIGFTIAGIIAAFVPQAFFQALFVGSGAGEPAFWEVFLQALIGPIAAFFTFIGSMGNIPLAAVLFGNGVSFAGVMAFIFSDLVVFPVLRIQAEYYGWKMAFYILGVFLAALVATALLLHYGFFFSGLLPDQSGVNIIDREFFGVNYNFFLNLAFIVMSGGFWIWKISASGNGHHHHHGSSKSIKEIVLGVFAVLSFVWLAGGLLLGLLIAS